MRKALTFLGFAAAMLLAIGIVVLASAGSRGGVAAPGDSFHYFEYVQKQAVWLMVAVAAAAAAIAVDYHFWRDHYGFTIGMFAVVVLLLGLVFAFPPVKGSYRWIRLTSTIHLQPSELAKLATVFGVSVWMDRCGWRVERFMRGAVVPCMFIGVFSALLVGEPDYGSTMVVMFVGAALMFAAGTRLRYLGLFGVLGLGSVAAFVASNANRMERIMAWWHGNEGGVDSVSTARAAYQLEQAITAFGRGGLVGVGYNHSMQKQFYLPEAHTDFIFAIGAEEFGLCFSGIVLALFVVVFACGMYVTLHASDRLGRLIALGMTLLLVVQAVVNIGVVTGCLPTKGLALPLISYGGTNLVSALIAIGTIMNVGLRSMSAERKNHPRTVTASV